MESLKQIVIAAAAAVFTTAPSVAKDTPQCSDKNTEALSKAYASFSKDSQMLGPAYAPKVRVIAAAVNQKSVIESGNPEEAAGRALFGQGLELSDNLNGLLIKNKDTGVFTVCLHQTYTYQLPEASRNGHGLMAEFYMKVCDDTSQPAISYSGGIVTQHGAINSMGLRPMTSIEPVSDAANQWVNHKQFSRSELPALHKGAQEIIARDCRP